LKDNDPITLPTKDLGTCEVYPQTLLHSPNGRFVSVCGDGEFIIYTALAWRNKAFGSALDFCWGSKENSNDYAIRESATSVKIFKNFVEKAGGLDVGFQAEGLTGGVLLGVKGQGGIGFYDWQTGGLVRRIEVDPKEVGIILICCMSFANGRRSIGLRMVNLSQSLVKIHFTSCDSQEKTTLLPFNLVKLKMMESRQPLRS
jgi:hypothetical protein